MQVCVDSGNRMSIQINPKRRKRTKWVTGFLRRILHRRSISDNCLQICASLPRPTEICEFPELKEGEKTIGRQILERFWAEDR